jgi:hypothetical protein
MNITKKQKQYSVLFIFVLLVSYFSFFDDYFKYLEVKKNGTSDACKSYYSEFPNGYFTEDVKVIEIQDLRDIVLVREFFNDYPNSEYSTVELINLEIWNDEIRRYDSIVASNYSFDKDAVEFFRTLLHYMRDENKSTIYVNLSGLVDLKDFEEYNEETRSFLDKLTLSIDNRRASDNISNCSNNYSEGNIEGYEEIVIASIDSSFENILSNNFIVIESVNQISNTVSNELLINIDYTIKNQHMGEYGYPEMPNIWEYYDMESNNFISYFLGVSIKFEFDFSIPNSNQQYTFRYDANPLSNVQNITSLESGYKEMTKQNFEDFSNTIANKFGIY